MKKISKIIALLLSITILLSTIPAFASYAVSSLTNNVARTSWMNEIKDDTLLSDISIPGTHDSAARIVDTMTGTWAQTQSMTIYDQLTAGVRFLDLRVRYNTGVYYNVEMCHGSITIWNGNGGHLTLYQVIGDIKTFLNNYPSETVIVCIKEDDGSNESNIVSSINQIKAEDPSFWYQKSATPKLGEVRGKMVVASRMSSMPGLWYSWGDQGSDGSYVQTYSNAIIQDRYNMGTTAKWNDAIVPTFEYAKKSGQWVINCLNTTGGGIAGVSANADTINPSFGRYDLHNNRCYGVILFDYINDNYTTKVIKCNDLVTKRQPNPENKEYYYRLNVNNPDSVPSGWTSCSLRLYYKANNGTGYEGSELLFENGDTYNGYAFVCQTGNYEFSGKLSGYPTRVVFQYNWGYGSDRLELDFKLYVSDSPSSSYTQILDTFFARTSGISTPQNGIDYFSVDSTKNPKPTSISFLNDSQTTINVPQVNSNETALNTFNTKIYDQYGVRWYDNASSYRLSKTISGMQFDGNTLKTTELANDNPQNTEAYVLASYTYGGNTITTPQNKKIILNTNPIPYTFVDKDNNALYSSSAYYGEEPTYNGDLPADYYDNTLHYKFNGWTPSTVSMTNNTFSPRYNIAIHHKITDTKAATCTEDGYSRTYCTDCDYVESSETYDATGHDFDHATKGQLVPNTSDSNAYYPFYCPNCNEELVDLRQYLDNDYSAYSIALKQYNDVLNDKDFAQYTAISRYELQTTVDNATNLVNAENVNQSIIDSVSAQILSAIDDFALANGITYHTISFVYNNGNIIDILYKEGTSASDINAPANTPTLISDSTHTIYRWQSVKDVTGPASYYEIATESKHTYNTFIFPSVTVAPTYTEQGTTTHKCLCGYTYTEYIPVLEYKVDIVYILDDEVLSRESKSTQQGNIVQYSIPSEYTFYKSTIEIDGTTTRYNSTEYLANSDAEIVVYLYSN